ncbi:hypothetical protein GQ457_02G027360 [Hibiscus cannabinus]
MGVFAEVIEKDEECVYRHMGFHCFSWSVGGGGSVLFWLDRWCSDDALCHLFSRLFRLACLPLAWVLQMAVSGSFVHDKWLSFFKRDLRPFELQQLGELRRVIGGWRLLPTVPDRLIWEPALHGGFSVKELSLLMHSFSLSGDAVGAFRVWDLGVPPKIQCFVWFVLLERLPTLVMLQARGVHVGASSLACVFCGTGCDEIQHILYDCSLARHVWDGFFRWWRVACVRPQLLGEFIDQGFGSFFSGFHRQWWLVGCAAVLWTLWLARNEVIFRGKSLELVELCCLVKLRSFFWVKADALDCFFDEAQWWCCPLDCSFPIAGRAVRHGIEWSPPLAGFWKFNVDGSARGKPGPAGCGGVLRDGDGHIIALFSGPLGILDSNVAEIRAIAAALDILVEGRWEGVSSFVIESDSAVALSWILHKERRPWSLDRWFRDIDGACLMLPCVCFNHVLREANALADVLAKGGVDRADWLFLCS